MMEIYVNGTRGMSPLAQNKINSNFLCSCALRFNGKVILLDCGEGTQISYQKSRWSFNDIDVIFLSHTHADHTNGLPGILLQMKNAGRKDPVFILGPANIEKIIKASITLVESRLFFDVKFINIENLNPFYWNDLILNFLPLDHHPISYGIKISTSRKSFFNREKAEQLNLPKIFWNKLQKGETVIYNGKIFAPNLVLEKPKTDISFCYIPDTKATANNRIATFIKNSDFTICECMYADSTSLKNQQDKYHMSLDDIKESKLNQYTQKLGLIHYSPAYRNPFNQFNVKNMSNAILCKDHQLFSIEYQD